MRTLACFLAAWLAFCTGFWFGVEAQPSVTRYSFIYGPSPNTAQLLGGK